MVTLVAVALLVYLVMPNQVAASVVPVTAVLPQGAVAPSSDAWQPGLTSDQVTTSSRDTLQAHPVPVDRDGAAAAEAAIVDDHSAGRSGVHARQGCSPPSLQPTLSSLQVLRC